MRKLLLLAAAVAAVVSSAAHAAPTFFLTIEEGNTGNKVECSYGLADPFACAFTGLGSGGGSAFASASGLNMNFGGSTGGWSYGFNVAFTNQPGSANEAVIQLTFIDVVNNTSATGNRLFVSATAIDFTLPPGPLLTLSGNQVLSQNGGQVGNVESRFYANAGNTNPAQTGFTEVTACDYDISLVNGCIAPLKEWTRGAGNFSLQDLVIFDLAQNPGLASGVGGSSNLKVTQVPEPMSTALVGLGLFGAALFSRRRKADVKV